MNDKGKKGSKPIIRLRYSPLGHRTKSQSLPAYQPPSPWLGRILAGVISLGALGAGYYLWPTIQQRVDSFFAPQEQREVSLSPAQTTQLLRKIGFYSLDAPFCNIHERDISQTIIYDQSTRSGNAYLLQARLTDRTSLEITVEDAKRGDGRPGINGKLEIARVEILHREEHVQATAVQATAPQNNANSICQALYRELTSKNPF